MGDDLPPQAERPFAPPPLLTGMRGVERRRGSRGWMIAAIVLFCLLVLTVLWSMGHSIQTLIEGRAGFRDTAGPHLEEVWIESAATSDKIAVVRVEGLIFGESLDGAFSMVEVIKEQLRRAAEDRHVKAVLLKIDSPGGEVLASDAIFNLLLDFQKNAKKPVIASMGGLAASGGYYVAAPCRWIVANDMTLTGSIGVIMSTLNYRGLMDKLGLRPEVFKSGAYKDMLRGSKSEAEISPEERAMVQGLVDQAFEKFKTAVSKGRQSASEKNRSGSDKGRPLDPDWNKYADGRVLTGEQAFKHGFVDELGDFEVALRRAGKLAGIEKANVVEYRQVFELSNLFRLFGQSSTAALKVDFGIDLPRLKAGRLYFLTPGFAP